MAVNIRKFVLRAHGLDELVATGTLTTQAARFLEAAVAAGLNVLVSGGTRAGRTTLHDWTGGHVLLREAPEEVCPGQSVEEGRILLRKPDSRCELSRCSGTLRYVHQARAAGLSTSWGQGSASNGERRGKASTTDGGVGHSDGASD